MALKLNFRKIHNVRDVRKKMFPDDTQQAFWNRIRVTQSGGSRYENGRKMPPQVIALLWQLITARRAEIQEQQNKKK